MEEDLIQRKEALIDRIGCYLEKQAQMSPIAARILASVVLSSRHGITFEQLVNDLGASKSTISTNLSLLESKGDIEYFMLPGDRKKYYVHASDGIIKFIDEKIEAHKCELEVQKDIIEYKMLINKYYNNDPHMQCGIKFHQDILLFLEESLELFQKLKITLTQNKKS